MNTVTFTDPGDSKTRGRLWAEEAEVLLEKITRPSLPLLQGLWALFCYEGVIGSGTKSVQYFMRGLDVYRSLIDIDQPQGDSSKDEARLRREIQATSWCLWGFYCCEW